MSEARIEGFRLSPLQEHLWSELRGAEVSSFRVRCALKVVGSVELERLQQAVTSVVERHEILRTTFQTLPGLSMPVQVIAEAPEVRFAALEGGEAETVEATEPAAIPGAPELDLQAGPALCVSHRRIGDGVILTLDASTLCLDRVSMRRLVAEIFLHYQDDAPTEEPEVQYADAAEWQHDLLEMEETQDGRAYWHQPGLHEGLDLVLPFELQGGGGLRLNRVHRPLGERLAGLETVAAGIPDATAADLGVLAWMALLSTLNRRRETSIGFTFDGRCHPELEQAVGLFERSLPILWHFDRQTRCSAVAEELVTSLRQAERWGEYFSWQPRPGQGGDRPTPLVAYLCEVIEAWRPFRSGDLQIQPLGEYSWTEPCVARLTWLGGGEEGARLELVYDEDRLGAEAAEQLLEHLIALLDRLVEQPDQPVEMWTKTLSPAWKERLQEFEQTARPLGGDLCLHQAVTAQVARTPDRPAVVFEGESLTYRELDCRANRLAHELLEHGVKPEDRIAVLVDRSLNLPVALLAILKAGGAFVPLDPEDPPSRQRFILDNAKVSLLVTTAAHGEIFQRPSFDVLKMDALHQDTVEPQEAVDRAVSPDALAYCMYTSGSTGNPKGVMISHRSILNRLFWMLDEGLMTEADVVLQKTPISFDASIWEVFAPWIVGAKGVIAAPGGHRDSEYLARLVVESQVTVLQMVPTFLPALLEAPALAQASSIRHLFCGGEVLAPDVAERFFEICSGDLHNLYGPTEAAIDTTHWRCRKDLRRRIPIGHPLANVQVHVLDPRGALLPAGMPGELCVGGTGLARGYLGQPARTAQTFLPDPFSQQLGGRLYRTGDLAWRNPDGTLDFVGRWDDQVKVRGVRIELGGIETMLRSHPGVREAVVIVHQDDLGRRRLFAYGVTAEGASPTVTELRSFLEERLSSAMLPAAITLLDEFPRTASGKVDRRALPEPYTASEEDYVAPATDIEVELAAIWREVLGVELIGLRDNFFHIGGDSILSLQAINRAAEVGLHFNARQMFEHQTLQALAALLEKERSEGGGEARGAVLPPLQAEPRDGTAPLSFGQERFWFLTQVEGMVAGALNLPSAVRLEGDLNVALMQRSLAEVIHRHEILRTTFHDTQEGPRQVIGSAADALQLPVVDLSTLAGRMREVEVEVERLAVLVARRPFDLTRGPLLRCCLLRIGPGEHYFFYTLAHIITDGLSMDIFVRETLQLYAGFRRGESTQLPPLSAQYADYAIWQRRVFQGAYLQRELEYWRERLQGKPSLELPTDRPRRAQKSRRSTFHVVHLPREISRHIEGLAKDGQTTVFTVVLAVFKVLLWTRVDHDDIAVATDVANRNRMETEGLIGFFVNQVILLSSLHKGLTFREVLARVRKTTMGAFSHQELPFQHLVEALRPRRDENRHPFTQIKVVQQPVIEEGLEAPDLRLQPLAARQGGAQLDLTLFVANHGDDWVFNFQYAMDLFQPHTIESMAEELVSLFEWIIQDPSFRLEQLDEKLLKESKAEVEKESGMQKKKSFSSFKTIKPKVVTVEDKPLVQFKTMPDGLRTVVPTSDEVDLADWASHNQSTVEKELQAHGSIFFRGFGIDNPDSFEKFAGTLSPDFFSENGEHPRSSVTGNVYTPVFYPPEKQLLWHNENSFNHRWPLRIYFGCSTPADTGGETPIVDSRKVLREIDPEVRRKFEELGVMYVRNYGGGLGLDWQTVFQTEDRAEVEKRCRDNRMEVDWREGDMLRTRCVRPATIVHPQTGESSWFNQAQHWHPSCLDVDTRKSIGDLFEPMDAPRNCFYGDGSSISDAEMNNVLDAYRRHEVSLPWQKGDVMLVDNVLAAHGRNPFSGSRKLMVAMADMLSYDDVQGSN